MQWRTPFPRSEAIPSVLLTAIALAIALASLFFKSTRSNANAGWSDAVRFWALLGFFGGLTMAGLLIWGIASNHTVPAVAMAIPVFVWIAHEAASYRTSLQRSIVDHPYFTEQHLALGLRMVPLLAIAGAWLAVLILFGEWALPRCKRALHGPRSTTYTV